MLMAWIRFHKLYESDSTLARNFLLYVDQQSYERNPPGTFAGLAASIGEYQGG